MSYINKLVDILCPGPNRIDVLHSLAGSKHFKSATTNNYLPTIVPRNQKTRNLSDSDLLKSLVKCEFDIMKQSPKGSLQKRVVRALLIHGISQTTLLREFSQYFECPRIDAGTCYAQGKMDYETMIGGVVLCQKDFGRKSIKDKVVEDAVKFILDKANIKTVSWGNIEIVLSENETVVLPKITRLATPKAIWDRYVDYYLDSGVSYINCSTFYEILRAITRSDQQILSLVDYVQSLLVTDTIENLQTTIDDILCDKEEKQDLSDYLSSLSLFLKYGFNHHAKKQNDNSTSHGLQFILGNPSRRCVDGNINKASLTCAECRFPHYSIDKIKKSIVKNNTTLTSEQVNDCLKVLDDALDRFLIYMGHKARCANQNESISKIEQDTKDKCVTTKGKTVKGLIAMDFKMKFNPISARESTIDRYGKRGISWHGFCIIYYLFEEKQLLL